MSRIAVRRAHADDQKAVTALITSAGGTQKMKKRWGQFNLAALIELGYLSVVAYEASDAEDLTLLGFAVFNDAPPKEPEKAELWFAALRGATPRATCLLYTSPSPRDATLSRMPSSA